MKYAYLEVTYRKGRPVAAYYYLPRREGDRSARSEPVAGGLVVDFTEDGRAIGIEITLTTRLDLQLLNEVLARLGKSPAGADEMAPLLVA
jgi:hypothetical protein